MTESTGGPATNTAFRGIALVVVAAILGVILLNSGLDNEVSATDSGKNDKGSDVVTSSTTTTIPVRPSSSVVVLVANGTRTSGAAGAYVGALEALGYSTLDAATANSTFDGSIVYFAPGYRAEAERMAIEMGVPAVSVQPLPVTPPVADIGSANLLLVLGPELASVEPGAATPSGSAADAGAADPSEADAADPSGADAAGE